MSFVPPYAIPLFALAATAGAAWSVIHGDRTLGSGDWTREERSAPTARRDLGRNEEASWHLIRLSVGESPHVHDHHDLTVTVLRGRARLHLGAFTHAMGPGDVAFVPRGTVHWAELTGRGPVEVHVTMTPPASGRDHREVLEPARERQGAATRPSFGR